MKWNVRLKNWKKSSTTTSYRHTHKLTPSTTSTRLETNLLAVFSLCFCHFWFRSVYVVPVHWYTLNVPNPNWLFPPNNCSNPVFGSFRHSKISETMNVQDTPKINWPSLSPFLCVVIMPRNGIDSPYCWTRVNLVFERISVHLQWCYSWPSHCFVRHHFQFHRRPPISVVQQLHHLCSPFDSIRFDLLSNVKMSIDRDRKRWTM